MRREEGTTELQEKWLRNVVPNLASLISGRLPVRSCLASFGDVASLALPVLVSQSWAFLGRGTKQVKKKFPGGRGEGHSILVWEVSVFFGEGGRGVDMSLSTRPDER